MNEKCRSSIVVIVVVVVVVGGESAENHRLVGVLFSNEAESMCRAFRERLCAVVVRRGSVHDDATMRRCEDWPVPVVRERRGVLCLEMNW